MATAQTIIDRSLRLVGALGSGESPTAQETTDVLAALNSMVDAWQADGLLVYGIQDVTKTLTAGDGTYTIGSGADINTARPVKVESARVTNGGMDYSVDVVDKSIYDAIVDKASESNLPELVYYYPAFPSGTIYLWPVPSVANVLTLSLWVQLQSFAAASDAVSLPPGYQRALEFNLAIEIAPEFGKAAPAEVVAIARDSKAAIKRLNMASVPIISRVEMATGRRVNIISGR